MLNIGKEKWKAKNYLKNYLKKKTLKNMQGQQKKECHNWYQSVIGGCYGTGMYSCSLWYLYCSNPPRY